PARESCDQTKTWTIFVMHSQDENGLVHRFRIADHNRPVSTRPEIAAGRGGGIVPTERDFQGVGLWRGADGSMSADGLGTNRRRPRKWPSPPRVRNSLPKC